MDASPQAHVEIAIQPRTLVQVNTFFVPQIVVRTRDPQLVDGFIRGKTHIFAGAMLYTTEGQECTSSLCGNWGASANLVTESATKRGTSGLDEDAPWICFVFPRIGVSKPGFYFLHVVVNAMTLPSPAGTGTCEVAGAVSTNCFNVVEYEPHAEKPSKC